MRFTLYMVLMLTACSHGWDEADRALEEGLRIDGRRQLGEDVQAHVDRLHVASLGIVNPIRSIETLERVIRLCEERLRKGYDERSALFDVKMAAVFQLSKIGGDHAAHSLVRLAREDLNWDGEAGFSLACAIVDCGLAALPHLDLWIQEKADPHAIELATMIREGKHPCGLSRED